MKLDQRKVEEQALLQSQIKSLVRSERRLYKVKATLDRQFVQINALNEFALAIIKANSLDDVLKEATVYLANNFAFKQIIAAQVDLNISRCQALTYAQTDHQFKTASFSLTEDSYLHLLKENMFYISPFHQKLKSKIDCFVQKLFTSSFRQGYEVADDDAILLISSYVIKSNQCFILLLDAPPAEMLSENERLPTKKNDFFLRLFSRYLEGVIENRIYQNQLEMFNVRLEKKIKERTCDLETMSEKFKNIFNNSPISIWELDCSALACYFTDDISHQKPGGLKKVCDKTFITPSDFLNNIRIVNLNKISFALFDVKSQEDMQDIFFRIISSAGKKQIKEVFQNLVKNKGRTTFQATVKTKMNKKIILNVNFSLESSDPKIILSRVLMSLFDVTELVMAKSKVSYLAEHDPLTGLYSRNLLYPFLSNAINRQSRTKTHIALFYLDLDKFKYINDSYGHDIGDVLLQQVAKRLLKACRADDLIIRVGGDEFAIIVHDLASPENAGIIANNILQSLEKPFVIKRVSHQVTTSIGIVFLPVVGSDVDSKDILKMSDIALFNAKDRGRNMFCFFDEEMNENYQQSIIIERELIGALSRNELLLYYQPIIALATGDLLGYEALIRWNFKKKKILTPDKFLSSLERMGLIVEVGQWVLRQACCDLLTMKEAGLLKNPDAFVSVNISTVQLAHKSFLKSVTNIIKQSNVPPECIVFEIKESVLINEIELATPILNKLRRLKIQIAIDNFGTGYSSLQYLVSLPFDYIKINQAFIKNASSKKKFKMILQAVLSLAESTGSRVIIEGVESNAQLNFVNKSSADLAQGYYFDKPKPLTEILKLHKLQCQA